MSTVVTLNGSNYSIPSVGSSGWGESLSSYLIAIPQGVLQKSGGVFTLTSEVDFGATYGLRVPYLRSKAANPAQTGTLRLGNDESISWRNNANSGDIELKANSSDGLEYNSILLADISSAQTFTNKTISGASNTLSDVGYSSLDLSNSITNADINASAAIARSKLDFGSGLVDADIAAAAAVALSKLEALTADRALVSDGSGVISESSVTATELGHLSGVTSSVQTQLNTNASDISDHLSDTTDAHAASAISNTPSGNLAATDVQSALDELQSDVDNRALQTDVTDLELALPSGDDFLQLEEQSSNPSNPASGSKRLFAKDDGKLYQIDSAGLVSELGSGSGGAAGRLYFEDRDAEDTTKLSLYADSGATPTDGTGGSPNITKALNTSTQITGDSCYRVSKDAADRQGEGFALETDVTLDAPVKAGEPITVQFRYRTSANYVDGDVKLFYYLVGDNELYALNGIDNRGVFGNDLNKETGDRGQFTASLNATSSTTSIRIIGHIASTNASAYDIDIDEVTIGTASTLTSPIMSDWVPYTPAIGGAGTVSNVFFSYKRVGETLLIRGRFTCGTVAASVATVALPSGLTIKTNNSSREYVGTYIVSAGTSNTNKMGPSIADNNTSVLNFGRSNYAIAQGPTALLNGNDIWTSSQNVHVLAEVQINEWQDSTNIISQTQASFMSGSLRASRNGTDQSGVNPNNSTVKVLFNSTSASTDYESGLVYDTANSRFVCSIPGTYNISASVAVAGTNVLNSRYTLILNVNSTTRSLGNAVTPNAAASFNTSLSDTIRLEAGDIVELDFFGQGDNSSSTLTIAGAANNTYFQASRIPDLSVIGLAGQKYEVVENEFSSDLTATPSPSVSYGTWYSPSSSFTIALTPGTWQIELQGSVGSPTNSAAAGNQITIETGLATNSTAGTGIVETFRTHHFCYATNNMSYERVNQTFEPVTITSSTNYYIQVRANNFSGSPTLNEIGYRVSSFSNLRLRARRLR